MCQWRHTSALINESVVVGYPSSLAFIFTVMCRKTNCNSISHTDISHDIYVANGAGDDYDDADNIVADDDDDENYNCMSLN